MEYPESGGLVPSAPITPSGWHSSWNKASSAHLGYASTGKHVAATVNNVKGDTLSGTAGHFTGVMRSVSPPLKSQTISGTIKGQALTFASTLLEGTIAIAIRVLKPDGTERGVLLAPTASDSYVNPPAAEASVENRQLLNSSESATITLSSVDAINGDYLVFEFGYRQGGTATNNFNVYPGPTSGTDFTDLTEDNTDTVGMTWVEFSGDIAFDPVYYSSSSTPADAVGAIGTADPTAVTPPTGMLKGDLVWLIADSRIASLTQAISATGGQTWTSHAQQSATTKSVRVFTTTFDGGNVGSANFDGTNDYMTRGAGLTGAADSKSGICSFWIKAGSVQGVILFGTSTLGSGITRVAISLVSGTLYIEGFNAAGTEILQISNSVSLTTGVWYHILASWNLLTAGTGRLYINDVSNYTETIYTNDTIDYTLADWVVGAYPDAGNKTNSDIAEFYFAPGQYLDFATESNRRKFITADLKGITLGDGGATPTGTQPLIYQRRMVDAAASTFATNKGTGGNFTVTGALTNGANVPFDGWSENPSVSFGSTTCNSAIMHVFRPPSTGYTWSVNVAQTSTNDTTDPFSALAGHTTTGRNPTVTLQGWHSPDDNTWGTLTGTGWEVTGAAQYRNTSGNDQSASFAHIISTSAQTLATPGKSQLTLGADNAQLWAITMAASDGMFNPIFARRQYQMRG